MAWIQTDQSLDKTSFEADLTAAGISFSEVSGEPMTTYDMAYADIQAAGEYLGQNLVRDFEVTEYADDIESEATAAGVSFTRDGSTFSVLTKSLDAFFPILTRVRDLTAAKTAHVLAIKNQLDSTLAAMYPVTDLTSLHSLLTDAIDDGLTNRATYLRNLSTWTRQLYDIFYDARTDVIAASTLDAIEAVSVSGELVAWASGDPEVTYEGAIAIED
jgi:hypothetical protein